MTDPRVRIVMLERSLGCFVSGCLALIPLLGLPWGVHALYEFIQVKSLPDAGPNPARAYLGWGLALGILGLCVSALLLALGMWCAAQRLEFI